jgi:hypothetical protein
MMFSTKGDQDHMLHIRGKIDAYACFSDNLNMELNPIIYRYMDIINCFGHCFPQHIFVRNWLNYTHLSECKF